MDKKFLPLEGDGEEIEVFFLGTPPPPDVEVDSMKILHVEDSSQECPACDTPIPFGVSAKGVFGCCPVGPKGEQGPVGEAALPDDLPKGFFKKMWAEIAKRRETEIKLDDTIPSDVVDDPVAGRIYRVKGLNKFARFIGLADENLFLMNHHDFPFYLNRDDEMLLKATELQVEEYINGLQG